MSTAGSARLFVAVFAALAIVTLVNTRAAFAQDVADSDVSSSDSSAGGADANWESTDTTVPPTGATATSAVPAAAPTDGTAASAEPAAAPSIATAPSAEPTSASIDETAESAEPTGPPIDVNAASAEKVLEIPQAKGCNSNDDPTAPCDGADADSGGTDTDQTINAPSPGGPPQTYDGDTAYNTPDPDWGTVDDYQNQQVENGPYVIYAYPGGAIGTLQRPTQVSASGFSPMSSPLTQAARPPLNQGAWMLRPTMSTFARPAGSPMMMSAPLVGFHH